MIRILEKKRDRSERICKSVFYVICCIFTIISKLLSYPRWNVIGREFSLKWMCLRKSFLRRWVSLLCSILRWFLSNWSALNAQDFCKVVQLAVQYFSYSMSYSKTHSNLARILVWMTDSIWTDQTRHTCPVQSLIGPFPPVWTVFLNSKQ